MADRREVAPDHVGCAPAAPTGRVVHVLARTPRGQVLLCHQLRHGVPAIAQISDDRYAANKKRAHKARSASQSFLAVKEPRCVGCCRMP